MRSPEQELEVDSLPFESVFDEELDAIDLSRWKRGVADRPRPTREDLIGLSFSGGGIRSATFNLGVIQAFAKKHLLRHVDYLSTVSGGGYIGSWLSSWAYYRCKVAGERSNHIRQVEEELNRKPVKVDDKSEPDQIHFLRQYSNYLTPRLGALSGDTLAFAGTYIRNLLLNQIILVTLAFALLGIPWIFCLLLLKLGSWMTPQNAALATMSGGLLLLVWVLWRISKNVQGSRADQPGAVMWQIVVPEFLFCALITISVWYFMNAESTVIRRVHDWYVQMESPLTKLVPGDYAWLLLVPLTAVMYTIFWFIGALMTSKLDRPKKVKTLSLSPRWAPVVWAFPAGLVAGAFVLLASKIVAGLKVWYVLTFGIPVGVLLVLLVGCVHLGLIGRSYYDGLREWWARLGGSVLAILICWFALCLITLFVPPGLKLLWHLLTSPAPEWVAKLWKGMGALGITGAVGGWLTVTFRGLFIAKGPNSGAPANSASWAPQHQKELLVS